MNKTHPESNINAKANIEMNHLMWKLEDKPSNIVTSRAALKHERVYSRLVAGRGKVIQFIIHKINNLGYIFVSFPEISQP